MGNTLADLLFRSAAMRPDHSALLLGGERVTYAALAQEVRAFAGGLETLGIASEDRVGILLEKQFEAVSAILGIAAAGAAFVPINPALRAPQIAHILRDCNVRALVTTKSRAAALAAVIPSCPDLIQLIVVEDTTLDAGFSGIETQTWRELLERGRTRQEPVRGAREENIAGILYTSGSTGSPKGVVLTHRNFVLAAQTVAGYLKYEPDDRILNLPPYSFGFGLSQLFTSLFAGVTAVLHTYLSPRDLMNAIVAERVTGVSGVPTVVMQLAQMEWPREARECVRYISVAGGRMPSRGTSLLRKALPNIDIYLMYGMTETLRATYLPPDEVDRRPNSMGKPIPNAEIFVLRPDGSPCEPGESGELVQKGPLIARGYWNDPARTAEVFRPAPGEPPENANGERAVWSGDIVTRDEEDFLYFVGRRDEMLKIRGYRVSPMEIEDVVIASGQVDMAAALAVQSGETDQFLRVFVTSKNGIRPDMDAILAHCRTQLPAYMAPQEIVYRDALPLTPNGKLDRKALIASDGYQAMAPVANDRVSRQGIETDAGFFRRWTAEAKHLLGIRKYAFRKIRDVFAWAFPGRPIADADTFLTLEGDSLSYVAVSTGIEGLLGRLPDDWERLSIAELERHSRTRSSSAVLRPDIALRALAIVIIAIVHARFDWLSGGAVLLLLLSGFSFARFNWTDDGKNVFRSVVRLAVRIAIPTWILLAVAFLYRDKITWSVLFFYANWTVPGLIAWWPPAWFLQVLFQIFLFMCVLAVLPGIGKFGQDRSYTFGLVLVALGLVLDVGTVLLVKSYWGLPKLAYQSFPQYFLWIFMAGWLVANSKKRVLRITTLVVLAAALAIATAAHGILPFYYLYGDSAIYWLLGGCVLLLWAPSISVPRSFGTVVTLLAQSTLFIYLFHWPLATFLKPVMGEGHRSLRFALGFLGSIALWLAWECSLRALRSPVKAATESIEFECMIPAE